MTKQTIYQPLYEGLDSHLPLASFFPTSFTPRTLITRGCLVLFDYFPKSFFIQGFSAFRFPPLAFFPSFGGHCYLLE